MKKSLGGLVLLGFVIGAGTFAVAHMSQTNDTARTPPTSQGVLGARSTVDGRKLELLSVKEVSSGQPALTKHIAIGIKLTNQDTAVLQFSPGLQAYVQDTAGAIYMATAHYTDPTQSIGGPIEPGADWTGILDFDIDAQSTLVSLVIQKDATSDKLDVRL